MEMTDEFRLKIWEQAKSLKSGHGVSLDEFIYAKELTRLRSILLQVRILLIDSDITDAINVIDRGLGMKATQSYGEQGDG